MESLHKVLKQPKIYTRLNDIRQPVLQGIKYFLEEEGRNPFYFGKDIFMKFLNSWMVGKSCPFQKVLTLAIMKLQQAGLDKYYERKHFGTIKETVMQFGHQNVDRLTVKITRKHFLKISMVLSFGYAAAVIVFLGEFLLSKK